MERMVGWDIGHLRPAAGEVVTEVSLEARGVLLGSRAELWI